MQKEIYLSSLEWTKTHDNIGGVMGNVVFKDNMPYETYQKLLKSSYFVLCDKDYITNLQTIEQQYSAILSENAELENKITNLQEELEELREDNYAYHQLMKMQDKREYRSKFLKEFQEEFGKNVFPDYDEIYKRYDKLKKENKRLNNIIDELEKYGHDTVGKYLYDNHLMIKVEDFLDKLNELKGDNK